MKYSKRGYSSVFLMLILGAMLALASAFIYASRETAIKSYSDGLSNLAGNSMLSEFDLDLKD